MREGSRKVHVVFAFLEPDELSEIEGEGPVRIVPDRDRLFVFAASGMGEDTLAAELSYAVTMHARESWMYVGTVVGTAGAA